MVKIYSIEGNIGSGKSTLVEELEKRNKQIIFYVNLFRFGINLKTKTMKLF